MGVLKDAFIKAVKVMIHTRVFVEKLAHGGEAGTRAAPARTAKNDKQVGLRFDWGSKFFKDGRQHQTIKLQINREVEDSKLKALLKKNGPHHVYAEATVDVSPPDVPTEKIVNGKKVPRSEEDIKADKQKVLQNRSQGIEDEMIDGL